MFVNAITKMTPAARSLVSRRGMSAQKMPVYDSTAAYGMSKAVLPMGIMAVLMGIGYYLNPYQRYDVATKNYQVKYQGKSIEDSIVAGGGRGSTVTAGSWKSDWIV